MQAFAQACLAVLQQPEPLQKAKLAHCIQLGSSKPVPISLPLPDHPARPETLLYVTPGKAPKRKWGSEQGRLALLHAIAHIELNAIDLAFDMIARFAFTAPIFPEWTSEFCADWLRVGQEEAKHFGMITDLMAKRGMAYGDLPVHGGMWDAAIATRDRVDARLAIAPLVLEARGLDVTPPMIEKLEQVGDIQAADVLQLIYQEEIGHVAVGVTWFTRVCKKLELEPQSHFKHLLQTRYTSTLKPPFNHQARNNAGLPKSFYV
ncbi:FIG00005326: uncharacterized protein [hydrothermal vent metagenome]|uniref:FIG00005326: uncharacterized protein n=1 Tax=hydrothermal vent metagenome TaxID=652676 RepID=A0A3B0S197_9ZZZZ